MPTLSHIPAPCMSFCPNCPVTTTLPAPAYLFDAVMFSEETALTLSRGCYPKCSFVNLLLIVSDKCSVQESGCLSFLFKILKSPGVSEQGCISSHASFL